MSAGAESQGDTRLPDPLGVGQKLAVRACGRGIGAIIQSPDSQDLIDGVVLAPFPIFPDDRGYFMEVARMGHGPIDSFNKETTQVSAALSYPGTIKAFHFHRLQTDCWAPTSGMLQVALADLRVDSPTHGLRNTLYVGQMRPWKVIIPPGVAHGYKVIGLQPALLVYLTDRFYNPADEGRIAHDDSRIQYDWELQHK